MREAGGPIRYENFQHGVEDALPAPRIVPPHPSPLVTCRPSPVRGSPGNRSRRTARGRSTRRWYRAVAISEAPRAGHGYRASNDERVYNKLAHH